MTCYAKTHYLFLTHATISGSSSILICGSKKKKFNLNITDKTGSIDATVFPEVAEEIYGVTGTNVALTAPGVSKFSPNLYPKKKNTKT